MVFFFVQSLLILDMDPVIDQDTPGLPPRLHRSPSVHDPSIPPSIRSLSLHAETITTLRCHALPDSRPCIFLASPLCHSLYLRSFPLDVLDLDPGVAATSTPTATTAHRLHAQRTLFVHSFIRSFLFYLLFSQSHNTSRLVLPQDGPRSTSLKLCPTSISTVSLFLYYPRIHCLLSFLNSSSQLGT